MKINEVIQEGVWDNLKTAGQTIKQGVGTVGQGVKQGAGAIGQGVKQGAGAVTNYAKQNYQQTMQARQQRFDQQAAQQFPQSKKWLGKEWSPQAQLRAKNIGTFAGDVAKTIAGASPGTSYFTKATPTIPDGEIVDTELGKFKKTAQGWTTETNTPVTDPNTVSKLNGMYQQQNPQPVPQVDTSKIQPAPRAGAPTSAEQAKLQAKLQAALQNQQGQQ
jgi:hypothetical protein